MATPQYRSVPTRRSRQPVCATTQSVAWRLLDLDSDVGLYREAQVHLAKNDSKTYRTGTQLITCFGRRITCWMLREKAKTAATLDIHTVQNAKDIRQMMQKNFWGLALQVVAIAMASMFGPESGVVAQTATSAAAATAVIQSSRDPVTFMFASPLSYSKDVGGFYVGRLDDGRVFNVNIFFVDNTTDTSTEMKSGAFWYQDEFIGEVVRFDQTSLRQHSQEFSVSLVRGPPVITNPAHEPISPEASSGGGTFWQEANVGAAVSATLSGHWARGREQATGVLTDNATHRRQSFVMDRKFKYQSVAKLWPFDQDLQPVSAKFTAIFPDLPYARLKEQVLKDGAQCNVDGYCQTDQTVVGVWDNTLTLRLWVAETSIGASSDYAAAYRVYEVEGGKATQLSLNRILDMTGSCHARLEPLVARRLLDVLTQQDEEAAFTQDVRARALEYAGSFLISPRGVTLHYSPRTDLPALPYVSGEVFVTLSPQDLQECWRPPTYRAR